MRYSLRNATAHDVSSAVVQLLSACVSADKPPPTSFLTQGWPPVIMPH